jgi:hypothetical protein
MACNRDIFTFTFTFSTPMNYPENKEKSKAIPVTGRWGP